jgi:hypothetical protein
MSGFASSTIRLTPPLRCTVGLYTPCDVQYRDDDKLGGARMRLLHGIADDSVASAPRPCRTPQTCGRHSTAFCGKATMAKCSTPNRGVTYMFAGSCVGHGPHIGFNQAAPGDREGGARITCRASRCQGTAEGALHSYGKGRCANRSVPRRARPRHARGVDASAGAGLAQ